MKVCKYCREEIDSKAKICPHCRKKQKGNLSTIIGILIVIIGISIVAVSIQNGMEEEKNNLTYEVTNEYSDSIGSYYLEGTVKNGNNKDYKYIQIEFSCYDKEGNNIGTALANNNSLGANETWKFKAIGLFTNKEVDHCTYKDITAW